MVTGEGLLEEDPEDDDPEVEEPDPEEPEVDEFEPEALAALEPREAAELVPAPIEPTA